jgi:hypothetical protein
MATTKISRAELDAVLNRTRSGTRPAVRPETSGSAWHRPEAVPESLHADLPGPRDDDGPEITIRKIESVEIDLAGEPVLPRESSLRAARSKISPVSPVTTFTPAPPSKPDAPPLAPLLPTITSDRTSDRPRGGHVQVALLIFLVGALVAAFFAGRASLHW